MVLQINEPSGHYDLIWNFPTHCYFVSILKISYFSPIPKGPFWFLQTANSGASIVWFCRISYWQPLLVARILVCFKPIQQRNKLQHPQGLMISCKSPSPKDNRRKLSRRWTTGTVMVFLPSRGSANRRFEATGVTALIRLIPFWVTTGWWFQTFFIFTLTWGNDPIWLIFVRWVETTN